MTDHEPRSRPECDRYAVDLPELALGILTGRERAQALAHVEGCPACHAEMERLSVAADSLLEGLPAVEPPLGFEVRLMERLGVGRGAPRPVRPRWHLRRPLVLAACLLLFVGVGLGVGAGWLARPVQRPTIGASAFGTEPGGHVETESLVSAGRTLGTVTVYSGRTSWLFMSLDDGSWSGKASCQVRLADGRTASLGSFWLNDGYGAWGVTIPTGTGPIETASVVTGKEVLASAGFSSAATSSMVDPGTRQSAISSQRDRSGSSWMAR